MQIEVRNLTKRYGETTVLDHISFSVDSGEILGFLGPNGAGKTTTMRILTGFLAPNEGSVSIGGFDISEHSLQVREKVGYLPENNPLYNEMRVYEYLEFSARAKGIRNIWTEVKRVIEICALKDRPAQPIGELSKGYRQRVGLAQALLGDPEIIILDEPTSGLDPNQIVEIRNLIKEIGRKKTIILSTHILSEVQASCTRAIIIHRGKIVASGTTDELIHQAQGKGEIRIILSERRTDVEEALRSLPGVESLDFQKTLNPNEAGYLITVGENIDLREKIFRLCVEKDIMLLGMEHRTLSLEDVFRQLTRD